MKCPLTQAGLIALAVLICFWSAVAGKEPVCHGCGRQIVQREYISVDGLNFHAACFRCAQCRQPITGEVRKQDTLYYDRECYQKHLSLWCAICGGEIIGEYVRDYWGNAYHIEHVDQSPRCDYCGRFITDKTSQGGYRYDDGRMICGICQKSAIVDGATAQRLMKDVANRLAAFDVDVDAADISLALVGKKALNERAESISNDLSGLTVRNVQTLGDSVVTDECTVYALTGMPRQCFVKVMAHELMHVWLGSHADADADAIITEGSCNYAAYLVLSRDDDPMVRYQLDQMVADSDAVYGSGFRAVKTFVDEHGVPYWLNYLKTNTSLPR